MQPISKYKVQAIAIFILLLVTTITCFSLTMRRLEERRAKALIPENRMVRLCS